MVFLGMQPEEQATMRECREFFGLGLSTTARTFQSLEREGIFAIAKAPDDSRAKVVRLTEKGHRIIDEVIAALKERRR